MVLIERPPMAGGEGPTGSTLADVADISRTTRGRLVRRVAVGAMTVLVVLGAAGAFGVRTTSATSSARGWTLTVSYAQVARAGLDVPLAVDLVSDAGPITQPVTLAIGNRYLDVLEHQDLRPDPDAVTAAPRFTYYSFAPPPGQAFRATFDTYVQPSAQLPASTDVVALVGGHEVARVLIRTWLAP